WFRLRPFLPVRHFLPMTVRPKKPLQRFLTQYDMHCDQADERSRYRYYGKTQLPSYVDECALRALNRNKDSAHGCYRLYLPAQIKRHQLYQTDHATTSVIAGAL